MSEEKKKALSALTKTELWQLFPIVMKPHNPAYFSWYEEAKKSLQEIVGHNTIARINHIGSSAIENLDAKPTVDILLEIVLGTSVEIMINLLSKAGWILMVNEQTPRLWLVFNQGYTVDGYASRVFHLHVRHHDDWDELYFRDYLKEFPAVAKEYGDLKNQLAIAYRHNRDLYTKAKTEFIKQHTQLARMCYPKRYLPTLHSL